MSNPKSAKDLAFDKERAKYRKQIRELESNLKKRDADVVKLQMEINKQSEEINQLKDWVARLLEYTELSEEEMKNIIDKDKNSAEITKRLLDVQSVMTSFGFGSSY